MVPGSAAPYHSFLGVSLCLNLLGSHLKDYESKLGFNDVPVTVYERVAVGRKFPCTTLLQICLLRELSESLFHVQCGLDLNILQSLYVQPFWLWSYENEKSAWNKAIHPQKGNNFVCKYSFLQCQSWISWVPAGDYKVTGWGLQHIQIWAQLHMKKEANSQKDCTWIFLSYSYLLIYRSGLLSANGEFS